MSAAAPTIEISRLIGPIALGVVINMFFYGIVVLQFAQYQWNQYRDGWLLRLIVNGTFIVDTGEVAIAMFMLWDYGVNHFDDVAFLGEAPWSFGIVPIFTGSCHMVPKVEVAVPIQHLFAWRIKTVSQSWLLFGILSALSWASGVLGFASAIAGLSKSNILQLVKFGPIAEAWLAVTLVCDTALSGFLFWHFSQNTGEITKRTENHINRLIQASVETTVFTALFVIADLVCFLKWKDTNFHLIFAIPAGRLYTATLYSALNYRSTLREEIADGPAFLTGNQFARGFEISTNIKPTEVTIAVEQDVQLDPYVPAARHSTKKGGAMGDAEYSFTPM
ncbi:hypothetical protein CERSUDRAFT_99165 [Gelatoporia subvermispora B]|uniref:DUF6534 domain-containing protein n=1 Tax=Ceriporiopsis subvermispora (strain B) TaxID=914234 RepID=M2Q7H2_CERS8|nr:hypothetical protein CERSUDRAFT_99165 [Gelatoporia subvermispora B]